MEAARQKAVMERCMQKMRRCPDLSATPEIPAVLRDVESNMIKNDPSYLVIRLIGALQGSLTGKLQVPMLQQVLMLTNAVMSTRITLLPAAAQYPVMTQLFRLAHEVVIVMALHSVHTNTPEAHQLLMGRAGRDTAFFLPSCRTVTEGWPDAQAQAMQRYLEALFTEVGLMSFVSPIDILGPASSVAGLCGALYEVVMDVVRDTSTSP